MPLQLPCTGDAQDLWAHFRVLEVRNEDRGLELDELEDPFQPQPGWDPVINSAQPWFAHHCRVAREYCNLKTKGAGTQAACSDLPTRTGPAVRVRSNSEGPCTIPPLGLCLGRGVGLSDLQRSLAMLGIL